jgi:hypothetical protein|tara:strand:- start:9647 stop:9802 length:156 start_codon:yes stop_codon:yes gene_type:complete
MINKEMNNNKSENSEPKEVKPNEDSGIYFSSSLKITDPDTDEVLVQMRGDS